MKSFRLFYGNKFNKCYKVLRSDQCQDFVANCKIRNDNNDCLLYFQGNIFNNKFLKENLYNEDSIINNKTNEQVIIKLYQKYGLDFVKFVDGEFAFCIYDFEKKNFIIYRSLMFPGQIYYSLTNKNFIVSTSLKDILQNRQNRINKYSLDLYMHLRFVPSPYTVIENIFKLENGYVLIFDGTKIDKKQIINCKVLDLENNNIKDVGSYIIESVNRSINEIKPSGVFLSGGLDSAIIASILSNNHEKVKAFSVGYEVDTKFDETKVAKNIANDLNLEHKVYKVKNSELSNLINESIDILEEPFYSTVSVSTLKLAQESSVDIAYVYSGDGSDELFYGYKYLRDALKNNNPLDVYVSGLSWLKEKQVQHILNSSILKMEDIKNYLFNDFDYSNIAELLRSVEMFKRFPEYHLFRLGKILNEFNLTSILPFTYKNLIEFALGLNPESIMDDIDPKIYLKNNLSVYLTKDMLQSKKQPFTAPNKEWIEGPLKLDINHLFKNKELFKILNLNQNECLNILNNYDGSYKDVSNIWGIYILLKWCERFKKFITNEEKYEEK